VKAGGGEHVPGTLIAAGIGYHKTRGSQSKFPAQDLFQSAMDGVHDFHAPRRRLGTFEKPILSAVTVSGIWPGRGDALIFALFLLRGPGTPLKSVRAFIFFPLDIGCDRLIQARRHRPNFVTPNTPNAQNNLTRSLP
jgi:hypothetical protein